MPLVYNEFNELVDDGSNDAGSNTGPTGPPPQWGEQTRDPQGGNWGLPEGDWIDRYPADVQDQIKRNWATTHQAGATPPAAPTAPGASRHGAPTAEDWLKATEGLTANESDQTSLGEVAKRLQAMGYDVKLAETDSQGRNQGLLFDGVLHRVIDSSNKWTLVSNANGDAWGKESPGGIGGELGPLTAPWTEPFNRPDWAKDDIYKPPDIPDYADFKAPDPFAAPDYEKVLADPGFKLRLREGQDVLENSAASQGRLLEGGYLTDLLKYGQLFGSGEYQNVYNREADTYDRNFGNSLTAYTTNRDTTLGKYGLQKGSYDDLYAAKNAAVDRAYTEYLNRERSFRANQNGAYDKLLGVSTLGANSAGA